MPLPPIKISDAVQKAAYDDLCKGAMRKFGDALAVIADRIVAGRRKSPEEKMLDWATGEQEAENRRRLAAEALDLVPPERRIFPASQIAGPIFRDSEFEIPESPIWEMWVQLLARACDSERVDEAHPSFAWIISQLSPDEAKLLAHLAPLRPRPPPFDDSIPTLSSKDIGLTFPGKLGFYLGHLSTLGLMIVPNGLQPTGYIVFIDEIITYMLTDFAISFVSAVSQHQEATG